MLSRVADSIYWMARYVERVANLARIIDVNFTMLLDLPDGADSSWQPLVDSTGDREIYAERFGAATRDNAIQFLTFDRDYPNSILSSVERARENARSVRETISSGMWEQLNQFYYMVNEAAVSKQVLDAPSEFFRQVGLASHLFQGITDGTMSHGEGWHFTQLGRMLERADKTSRLLDVKYRVLMPTFQGSGSPIDDMQWTAVLKSVSGFEMYRKRHQVISPTRVIDFLILDRQFPRAIQFCLTAAESSLCAISGTTTGSYSNLAEQRIGQLRSELAYSTIDDIIESDLHNFLDSLQSAINEIDDAIYETFIDMRPVQQSLVQQPLIRN